MNVIMIPGFGVLELSHLVLDYNGTLARDGNLVAGVLSRLHDLSESLKIHVLTADTFGTVLDELRDLPCELMVLGERQQAEAKQSYVERLNSRTVAAIGNGRNDRGMLESAALGIAIIQQEGAAPETIRAANVVVPSILYALDLLNHPLRLVATLRD
jgi:soluble P-type ATPase